MDSISKQISIMSRSIDVKVNLDEFFKSQSEVKEKLKLCANINEMTQFQDVIFLLFQNLNHINSNHIHYL